MVTNEANGVNSTNGHEETMATGETPYLTTQPPPDQDWRITLAGKVIAITGANRGIGLGIAEVCLANSAAVVYSLDLMEPGEDFAALQKKHPGLKYIRTNVTEEASVEKALDAIVEAEGRVDGMVANAGVTKHQPALQFTRDEVEKLFDLNVSPSQQRVLASRRAPTHARAPNPTYSALTHTHTPRSSAPSPAPSSPRAASSRSGSRAASSSRRP